jgi:hypothetical protein
MEGQQSSARLRLFGRAAGYLDLIEAILPRLTTHRYQFLRNDVVSKAMEKGDLSPSEFNGIHASEILDNSHLAATTALIRTSLWVRGMCSAYTDANFLSWAAAARGLIESSGDVGDGLLNVAATLAFNHVALSSALQGRSRSSLNVGPLEQALSHYIRAKWTRDKSSDTPRARDNIEYVRWIEKANIPGMTSLYHKLCGVAHPASGSFDYLYRYDNGRLWLDMDGNVEAIEELCREFPEAFPASVMLACNNALLILRVLHKFGRHPKLPELRKLPWQEIKAWPDIDAALKGSAPPAGAKFIVLPGSQP